MKTKTNELKPFAKSLFQLRVAKSLTQAQLEGLLEAELGKGMVPSKIVSRWEDGTRKNPRGKYYQLVEALDRILSADGSLVVLYKQPPAVDLENTDEHNLSFLPKQMPQLVQIARLLPEGLTPDETAQLIQGLLAFFAKSGLKVSDSERCKAFVESAVALALS
jgi:transcriptional regulator with XRE-family HTH domain